MHSIYFARHGETVWNVENKICGMTDSPLTEKGRQQARELGRKVKESGVRIDEILYSPLSRAADTAKAVAEATGLPVQLFLSHEHGGSQQIGARIAYNEIDMVLFFSDPQSNDLDADLKYITTLCDQYNIPFATNVATAEILIHGLERGDLDWRDIINPKTKPFTA